MKEAYQIPEAYLAVYARCPRNGSYPDGLARSIHFAVSRDGKVYEPLYSGYGMLFATGEVRSDNTIEPKGVKNPRIFRDGKGQFGITAVRVLENGEADESSRGKVLLWLTKDLEDFGKEMLIDLKMDRDAEVVICRYGRIRKEVAGRTRPKIHRMRLRCPKRPKQFGKKSREYGSHVL